MRTRRALVLAAIVNALALGTVGFVLMRQAAPAPWHGTRLDPPMPGHAFALESADGAVSSDELHGSPTILFFGYTSCPDACPLTLAKLKRVRDALDADEAAALRVVLVTVDPERDTAARLDDYVARFDTSFVGLTGPRAEIERLAKAYGIYHAAAAPTPHADHGAAAPLIDHTTHVLMLDRSGRLALLWDVAVPSAAMAEDIRRLLAG
jgi:protein SCO1/2